MKHTLRVIEIADSSTGEPMYIATNCFDLTAEEITGIYRLRWQIELFFKWIKQHLKIKKFYGTSLNAIQNQLHSALILLILLKFMHLLVGEKHNFLKLVRHIAGKFWNTMEEIYNLRYKDSVEDRVHKLLSERLQNIYNVFGQLPDTLEDVWVEVAENEIEKAKEIINNVPKQNPFKYRYQNKIDKVDWENCTSVLSVKEKRKYLQKGWRV